MRETTINKKEKEKNILFAAFLYAFAIFEYLMGWNYLLVLLLLIFGTIPIVYLMYSYFKAKNQVAPEQKN